MNNEDVSTVIITLTNNFSVSAPHLVCPRAPEYIEAFFLPLSSSSSSSRNMKSERKKN